MRASAQAVTLSTMISPDPAVREEEQREKNNAAARRSRAKARIARADESWIISPGAGLTAAEQIEAIRFMCDEPAVLTPAAKDAVRKHLLARRAVDREKIGTLLARLDAM